MKQYVARRSFSRGASQATNLNADSRRMVQHVLDATVEEPECTKQVQSCHATEVFVCGRAVLLPGQHFWLVASKFEHRFYVVLERDGQYQCSSRDEKVARWCIRQVEAARERRKQAA